MKLRQRIENNLKKWESKRTQGKKRFVIRHSLWSAPALAIVVYMTLRAEDISLPFSLVSSVIIGVMIMPFFFAMLWGQTERQYQIYKETDSIQQATRFDAKQYLKDSLKFVGWFALVFVVTGIATVLVCNLWR